MGKTYRITAITESGEQEVTQSRKEARKEAKRRQEVRDGRRAETFQSI